MGKGVRQSITNVDMVMVMVVVLGWGGLETTKKVLYYIWMIPNT